MPAVQGSSTAGYASEQEVGSAQEHSPFSDATPHADMASSSKSTTSEHRQQSAILVCSASRDLDEGVQEWAPHVWEKGPPVSPCEQERLNTLHSIAPAGKLESLHHPNLGERLCLPTQEALARLLVTGT